MSNLYMASITGTAETGIHHDIVLATACPAVNGGVGVSVPGAPTTHHLLPHHTAPTTLLVVALVQLAWGVICHVLHGNVQTLVHIQRNCGIYRYITLTNNLNRFNNKYCHVSYCWQLPSGEILTVICC